EEGPGGEARQLVGPAGQNAFRLGHRDLRLTADWQQQLQTLLQDDRDRPFDLRHGPLLRGSVYRTGDRQRIFSYGMHHIISDGSSMEVLLRELLEVYRQGGSGHTLEALPIQYKDYAAWEAEQLREGALDRDRQYWTAQLGAPLPVLELPGDRLRPAIRSYRGGRINRTLDSHCTASLTNLLQQEGCTLFMGLLAAVNALLYRYTGQHDLILGSPVGGRAHADLQQQLGCYLNTVALRNTVRGQESFRHLLRSVRERTMAAYDHQRYPFDLLVEELKPDAERSRHPLFDVLIDFHDRRSGFSGDELPGLNIAAYNAGDPQGSKFDLTFLFSLHDQQLHLQLEYNGDLFDRPTAERMAGHFEQLLRSALLTDGHCPIDRLDYIDHTEKQTLLLQSTGGTASYEPVLTLFRRMADNDPGGVALAWEGGTMTYGQLDELSTRLGFYLHDRCAVAADDRVGILLGRSAWMVVSILAVLKSGGCYVPLDVAYPAERRRYMIGDADLRVLLTDADHLLDLDYPGQVLAVDVQLETMEQPPLHWHGPTDEHEHTLAYLLYTSGSTGKPKGCGITRGNLAHYVGWANAYYFDQQPPVFGLFTS